MSMSEVSTPRQRLGWWLRHAFGPDVDAAAHPDPMTEDDWYMMADSALTAARGVETLAAIQRQSFRIAEAHGFWAGPEQDNVPTKIALAHGELSEALQEYREGHEPTEVYYVKDKDRRDKPEGFGIELADAVIRICDLAQRHGVDLTEMIKLKSAYNEGRPHMHGRRV